MQSTVGPETTYFPRLFVTYTLFGIGAGISLMPLTLLAMAEVPAADAGLAAGITNVSMQVSAALGLAALGSVAADRTRSLLAAGAAAPAALTDGFQLAFTIAACLVGGALIVVLVALRPRRAAAAPEVEHETGLPPAA
jgi:hypothetical protein